MTNPVSVDGELEIAREEVEERAWHLVENVQWKALGCSYCNEGVSSGCAVDRLRESLVYLKTTREATGEGDQG